MTLGPLAFLSPWLLLALAALPAIWWLLRTTPPRPRSIRFPATRLLLGLRTKKQTPARTPWWLTAIRMLAAALVILALADPILNPSGASITGSGPLAIVLDNGWAASNHWPERQAMLNRLLAEAESKGRPVLVIETAADGPMQVALSSPRAARERAAAIVPKPYPPDRMAAAESLQKALVEHDDASVVWLSDGLDYGSGEAFGGALANLANGSDGLTIISFAGAGAPQALRLASSEQGKLTADILTLPGSAREGVVRALSGQGQPVGEAAYRIAAGASKATASFELPLEIANQVARLELAGERSAAAVHLLDARSRWQRVALISGETREQAQPLLAPLYYLDRALKPYAALVKSSDANMATALDDMFERQFSMLVLANIGKLVGRSLERIESWVKKGGMLVRFAGPRLEKAGDRLLPVPLRFGGRTLGGALSWSEPQILQPFDKDSLFSGLAISGDVSIRRQVLADPTQLGPKVKVWARLGDGTPLVTARKLGEGWLVLFHVTANSDWSNLPISGLFVEMLRRLSNVSTFAFAAGTQRAAGTGGDLTGDIAQVLVPQQTLDAFGTLTSPPVTAQPIPLADFAAARPSAAHPPGLYGPPGGTQSLNLIGRESKLTALSATPSGARLANFEARGSLAIKPWLFLAAFALIVIDVIAVMLIQSGGLLRSRAAPMASSVLVALVLFALAFGASGEALAQSDSKASSAFALEAALKTRFAYALTGDEETDRTSSLGLSGLSKILAARTAVEPADPIGVDIARDELAFFPIIYWPVLANAQPLDDPTVAKVDAYMKQGGMIVFDTRDYAQSLGLGGVSEGPGARALQRLLGKLDLPRIEPVPQGHVLTKSFYLLSSFPGRWDGGALWVEAQASTGDDDRQARQSDGVSSILITSNDFAAAWALDDSNRPLFAVVPGGEMQREMSFRTGVNIVMYALTGNYKADQVHVPALLERLGQ